MAVEYVADSEFFVKEDTFADENSFDWPQALAAAATDAVAAVAIVIQTDSVISEYPTATISVGGVDAAVYEYQYNAVGFGTGRSHLILALVPLAEAANDDLVINWDPLSLEATMVVQAAVFSGVDTSALASAVAVTAAEETTLGPLAVADGDAIVVAGAFYTGGDFTPLLQGADITAYEMLPMPDEFNYFYYSGHQIGVGYRIFSAAISETVTSLYDLDYLPGIAFVLPAVTDAFNCSCEDETNYRTLAQLRAEIIGRLGFEVSIASTGTLEELRDRIIARLGFVSAKAAIPGKTLTQLRTYLMVRLGFAAQVGSPPPGMLDLLDSFVNEAQDMVWRRYAYDGYGGTAPAALTAGTDTCSLDSMAIQMVALGYAKLHYGQQDGKTLLEQFEQYLKELLQRHPLNLESQIDQCINQAQETLWRKNAFNGGTAPARLVDDSDECTVDAAAVELLAMANAKAFYKQDDAKALFQQLEDYLKLHPFNLAAIVTSCLQDAQRQLYRRYAALRTERFYRWTMVAGERFYDLPDNDDECAKELDAYKITWVGVEDLNGTWYPLTEGISPTLYTSVNSQGLPSRYEVRQCIEVFPAPAAAYTLRVKGHFGLEAFAADGDQTTIDDHAVYLLALAQAKAHYKQPDAQNYFSQAANHMGALVAGAHHTARYVPGAKVSASAPRPRMVQFDDE